AQDLVVVGNHLVRREGERLQEIELRDHADQDAVPAHDGQAIEIVPLEERLDLAERRARAHGHRTVGHRVGHLVVEELVHRQPPRGLLPYAPCKTSATAMGRVPRPMIYWSDDGDAGRLLDHTPAAAGE